MLKKIIFLDHKKYFLNLNNSQRLGLLILSSIILFNKWTWLWFFDSDGVLSFSASQKFFFFDLLLFTLGISLFALKIKINFKRTFKIIAYLLYVVFILVIVLLVCKVRMQKQLKWHSNIFILLPGVQFLWSWLYFSGPFYLGREM